MISDKALEGYAKQYQLYCDRLAKEGRKTAFTFEEYIEIKERFRNYENQKKWSDRSW